MKTCFYIIRHALKPKHKIRVWTFYIPMYQCALCCISICCRTQDRWWRPKSLKATREISAKSWLIEPFSDLVLYKRMWCDFTFWVSFFLIHNNKFSKKPLNSLQIRTKYSLILNVKLSDQNSFLQGNERAVYWLTFTT